MKDIGEHKKFNTFKGKYRVSSKGDIFSVYSKRNMKLKKGSDGYYQIELQHKGLSKWYRVHRLVGYLYLEGYFGGAHINHKDGNKLNNDVTNLEWCTNTYNAKHAHSTGLCENSKKTQFKKGHTPWNKSPVI